MSIKLDKKVVKAIRSGLCKQGVVDDIVSKRMQATSGNTIMSLLSKSHMYCDDIVDVSTQYTRVLSNNKIKLFWGIGLLGINIATLFISDTTFSIINNNVIDILLNNMMGIRILLIIALIVSTIKTVIDMLAVRTVETGNDTIAKFLLTHFNINTAIVALLLNSGILKYENLYIK